MRPIEGTPERRGFLCAVIKHGLAVGLGSISVAGLLAEPTALEIERLIRHLGSTKFNEREAASKALEALGEPALEHLLKVANASNDIEVRTRARAIASLMSG